MASLRLACTVSLMTSERTCEPYCCATILNGTLPGRNPAIFTVFGQLLEALLHFALDLRLGHRDMQPAFELAERLQSHLHAFRFLAMVRRRLVVVRWCERRDSRTLTPFGSGS